MDNSIDTKVATQSCKILLTKCANTSAENNNPSAVNKIVVAFKINVWGILHNVTLLVYFSTKWTTLSL